MDEQTSVQDLLNEDMVVEKDFDAFRQCTWVVVGMVQEIHFFSFRRILDDL